MQLLLLLYYLAHICRKLIVIYNQLDNNHLIQLLWVFFIHFMRQQHYVQKLNEYSLLLTQPMKVLDVVAATSK